MKEVLLQSGRLCGNRHEGPGWKNGDRCLVDLRGNAYMSAESLHLLLTQTANVQMGREKDNFIRMQKPENTFLYLTDTNGIAPMHAHAETDEEWGNSRGSSEGQGDNY